MNPEQFKSNEPLPARFPKPDEYDTWGGTELEYRKLAWDKYEKFSDSLGDAKSIDDLNSALVDYAVYNNEDKKVLVGWLPFGDTPEYDLETPLEDFQKLFTQIEDLNISEEGLRFVHGEMSLHAELYAAFLRIFDLEKPEVLGASFNRGDLA